MTLVLGGAMMEVRLGVRQAASGSQERAVTGTSRPGHNPDSLVTEENLRKVFFQSWAMNGETGLREAGEKCRSSGVMGWTNGGGSMAVVAGFLDHSTSNTRLEAVHFVPGAWRVTATILREGVELAPGETLEASPFWLQKGPGLSALLEQYAEAVTGTMGKRKQKPAESGWCSWYHYYGKETFDDVVSCATELASSPAAAFLRTVQIDDGWNRAAAANLPEAWGDWEAHPDKFPSGMAEAARRIHEMGFRAGLWLAPLAVARESRFFQEHADWLVQHRDPETGETSPFTGAHPPRMQSATSLLRNLPVSSYVLNLCKSC